MAKVILHCGRLKVTPSYIKVSVLAIHVHAGDSIESVARFYDVSIDEVKLALKYCPSFKSRLLREKRKRRVA